MTDWSNIVRQYGPLVWNTAYRLLSNDADASDCFQETFVSALKLSRQEPIRHWPAMLKRLTTARALEILRKRYRRTDRHEAWPESPVIDDRAVDPIQRISHVEVADHLREALAQIDPRQAEVFCLTVIEEQAYQTVAEQLGLTVSHVGVLLHRAKKSLQDRMTSHQPSSREDHS